MKHKILSPIMGSVSCVYCETGAAIEEGEIVLTVECLKMFTDVQAPANGAIQLLVKPGMQIHQDQWIATVLDNSQLTHV